MNPIHSLTRVFQISVALSGVFSLSGCAEKSEPTESADLAVANEACRSAATSISVTPVGRYDSGIIDADRGGAEITAYDRDTRRLFVVNLKQLRLDVVDISDVTAPVLVTSFATPGDPTSVAVSRGLVAVSSAAATKTDPGLVQFYDAAALTLEGQVTVGAQPDMVTFTPDGKSLLVANEGEPSKDYAFDPPGSVSIIDVPRHIGKLRQSDVITLGFDDTIPLRHSDSIRLYGHNTTVEFNLEPEYIAVSNDGRTAWVTLQENNAIATLDLKNKRFTAITGLGFKDHNVPGNGLDVSDKDGVINIANWPVYGIYEPDGVAAIQAGKRTFLVTANEGDAREWGDVIEETTITALAASGVAIDAEVLALAGDKTKLGRLAVSAYGGVDLDGDGDIDRPLTFGARSFSIWSPEGTLVFDSGDEIEQTIAALLPSGFNADNKSNPAFDKRSSKKGPEPEGLAVAELYGKQYLFLGLERVGGFMVYDVSNPVLPVYVNYVNDRDFAATTLATAGDLGPEGLRFIGERESPTGKPMLIVSNEVSGTVRLYEITPVW
jgi:DNA-binding beta-propeller fold protein YncE